MRKTPYRIVIAVCMIASAVLAAAQFDRKPGLWEVTAKMTWKQLPAGKSGHGGASPPMNAPHTTQVCLTQEMIDKYGGPILQTHNNDCQVSNMHRTANSMTADWNCNGRMKGKGTIEYSWTDENQVSGKIHFVGTMQLGESDARPVEWTNESTSIYKGPDCGDAKPGEVK